jgi:hypothetical protein
VITLTDTAPVVSLIGVLAVIDVPVLSTVTDVAATPSTVTAVAPVNDVPVIVISVLPARGPLGGDTLVTFGTGNL